MSASDEPGENPYAPSSLYEPASARRRRIILETLHARGRISWEDREQGMRLAGWVTGGDWRYFYLRLAVLLGFGLLLGVQEHPFWLLVFGGIGLVSVLLKGLWARWARISAARAQADHGDRQVQRWIDDDGIWSVVEGQRQLTPWRMYQYARVVPEYIVLMQGKLDTFQIFPRHHFASEPQWLLFQQAVSHYVRHVR